MSTRGSGSGPCPPPSRQRSSGRRCGAARDAKKAASPATSSVLTTSTPRSNRSCVHQKPTGLCYKQMSPAKQGRWERYPKSTTLVLIHRAQLHHERLNRTAVCSPARRAPICLQTADGVAREKDRDTHKQTKECCGWDDETLQPLLGRACHWRGVSRVPQKRTPRPCACARCMSRLAAAASAALGCSGSIPCTTRALPCHACGVIKETKRVATNSVMVVQFIVLNTADQAARHCRESRLPCPA